MELKAEKQSAHSGDINSVAFSPDGKTHEGSNHTVGSVSYWAHCVAFYDFWERENSLEKKLRCGKAKKGSGRI